MSIGSWLPEGELTSSMTASPFSKALTIREWIGSSRLSDISFALVLDHVAYQSIVITYLYNEMSYDLSRERKRRHPRPSPECRSRDWISRNVQPLLIGSFSLLYIITMQSDSRTLLTTNAAASSSSAAGKPDRLYVGNLSPSVDEYTLIQVFQKYGRITKLDFMFHKTGVLKGKPRGYAFVEFSSKDVSHLIPYERP
jgi:hypothetical protein